MYRIAVIENEVEMQHSGYVDSVPKFNNLNYDLNGVTAKYDRFSSLNIDDLFKDGENYLLEYDCLIIGTNATSDEDVKNALQDNNNKKVLSQYIQSGKGLLICSQKKLDKCQADDERISRIARDSGIKTLGSSDENEQKQIKEYFDEKNPRVVDFLPDEYKYYVVSRPKDESSADGTVVILPPESSWDKRDNNSIENFVVSYPTEIKDEAIQARCERNDFQQHYYRDYIIPGDSSAYLSILGDNTHTEKDKEAFRNTLMVARPRKGGKIIISTMALDWAGHYDLIYNILYYLIIGIPTIAFFNKRKQTDGVGTEEEPSELRFLIAEADTARVPYKEYNSFEELDEVGLKKYHSLFVFSPQFEEEKVNEFWWNYGKQNERTVKLFHYRHVENPIDGRQELILVKYSYDRNIDTQKQEVETWLRDKWPKKNIDKDFSSKANDGFWENSFWKTFDVLFALEKMDISIESYLPGVFARIEEHYSEGSYDGVLAPTCGLLELEALIKHKDNYRSAIADKNIDEYFEKTKAWLINKYNETTTYNKKFIARSFDNAGFFEELLVSIDRSTVGESIPQDEAASNRKRMDSFVSMISSNHNTEDASDIDLCLEIDYFLIIYNKCLEYKLESVMIERNVKKAIEDYMIAILNRQGDNGRWENNLGETARLLVFLLQHVEDSFWKNELRKDIKLSIDRGVVALRNSYHENNWDRNLVTTAKAITVMVSVNTNLNEQSKDFFNQVSREVKYGDSFNTLKLALQSINSLTREVSMMTSQVAEGKAELKKHKAKESEYEKKISDHEASIKRQKAIIKTKDKRLRGVTYFTVISVMLICSYYVYLYLNNQELFLGMIKDTMTWVPVVVGIGITWVAEQIIKWMFKDKTDEESA